MEEEKRKNEEEEKRRKRKKNRKDKEDQKRKNEEKERKIKEDEKKEKEEEKRKDKEEIRKEEERKKVEAKRLEHNWKVVMQESTFKSQLKHVATEFEKFKSHHEAYIFLLLPMKEKSSVVTQLSIAFYDEDDQNKLLSSLRKLFEKNKKSQIQRRLWIKLLKNYRRQSRPR